MSLLLPMLVLSVAGHARPALETTGLALCDGVGPAASLLDATLVQQREQAPPPVLACGELFVVPLDRLKDQAEPDDPNAPAPRAIPMAAHGGRDDTLLRV